MAYTRSVMVKNMIKNDETGRHGLPKPPLPPIKRHVQIQVVKRQRPNVENGSNNNPNEHSYGHEVNESDSVEVDLDNERGDVRHTSRSLDEKPPIRGMEEIPYEVREYHTHSPSTSAVTRELPNKTIVVVKREQHRGRHVVVENGRMKETVHVKRQHAPSSPTDNTFKPQIKVSVIRSGDNKWPQLNGSAVNIVETTPGSCHWLVEHTLADEKVPPIETITQKMRWYLQNSSKKPTNSSEATTSATSTTANDPTSTIADTEDQTDYAEQITDAITDAERPMSTRYYDIITAVLTSKRGTSLAGLSSLEKHRILKRYKLVYHDDTGTPVVHGLRHNLPVLSEYIADEVFNKYHNQAGHPGYTVTWNKISELFCKVPFRWVRWKCADCAGCIARRNNYILGSIEIPVVRSDQHHTKKSTARLEDKTDIASEVVVETDEVPNRRRRKRATFVNVLYSCEPTPQPSTKKKLYRPRSESPHRDLVNSVVQRSALLQSSERAEESPADQELCDPELEAIYKYGMHSWKCQECNVSGQLPSHYAQHLKSDFHLEKIKQNYPCVSGHILNARARILLKKDQERNNTVQQDVCNDEATTSSISSESDPLSKGSVFRPTSESDITVEPQALRDIKIEIDSEDVTEAGTSAISIEKYDYDNDGEESIEQAVLGMKTEPQSAMDDVVIKMERFDSDSHSESSDVS